MCVCGVGVYVCICVCVRYVSIATGEGGRLCVGVFMHAFHGLSMIVLKKGPDKREKENDGKKGGTIECAGIATNGSFPVCVCVA